MKIYVVTEGRYSDYHIDAVFLSEDEAKIYCATMCDADAFDDDCRIEEYDTDADHVEAAPGTEVHYKVVIRPGFSGEWDNVHTRMTLKPLAPFKYMPETKYMVDRYVAVLSTGDEDKVLKIFRDWRAQKKAEEAGL